FLAAVVKGTRFVVISGEKGARVQVQRGTVAVADRANGDNVRVTAGQEVSAAPERAMEVRGRGELPVVRNAEGVPVEPARERGNSDFGHARGNDGNSGNGKGGNSGNAGGNGGGNAGNNSSNSGNAGNNSSNSGNAG